jgi:hypothetical protein
VSFDLDVLAVDRDADDGQVRAMVLRCRSPHPEGELDERVVSFYEVLRARYPDHPPLGEVMPWAIAAQRVVDQLPSVELRLWEGGGHLEGFHREEDVMRELLSRAETG